MCSPCSAGLETRTRDHRDSRMAEGEDNLGKETYTPEWVLKIEHKLQRNKLKLAHELGAGAKCLVCKEQCPGLELHFWRKTCKNCKCPQDVHDVVDDDEVRIQILFMHLGPLENYAKSSAVKSVLEVKVKDMLRRNAVLQQFADKMDIVKPMKFDWVPPKISPSLAAEYMNELPSHMVPISGSVGAKYRKIQMKKQIPMHDVLPIFQRGSQFTQEEKKEFDKYIENLQDDAGIARVVRVKQPHYSEHSAPFTLLPAQLSGNLIRPVNNKESVQENVQGNAQDNVQDLRTGFRNINIRPSCYNMSPVDVYNKSPVGFRPFRPPSYFVEASPRSAMRSLPHTIPPAILRLPSSFKPKMSDWDLRSTGNINDQSLNNNTQSLDSTVSVFADNEESADSFDITGVSPLPHSPSCETGNGSSNKVENGQPSITSSSHGTSTPLNAIELPDLIVTPSKTAERMSYHDSIPPSSAVGAVDIDQNIVSSSDQENANNQSEAIGVEPEADIVYSSQVKQCAECQGAIEYNSVVVYPDNLKIPTNYMWHPKCFVCKECKELLVNLVYVFHKGNVYCPRHYSEKLQIQRCFACDELIFVKEYTLAEGNYYHLHHFCCVDCDMELAGKQYVLNDLNKNHPTCLECFENIYAKKCLTCKGTIKAEQQGISLNNLTWHASPECFKCSASNCNKPLANQKFIIKNSAPFCSRECYNLTINQV